MPQTPEEADSKWRLKPLQIAGLHESIEITEEGVTLGRSDTNTLQVPETGYPYVSSSHARIWLLDGEAVIEDLGSKNGTQINGRSVERSRVKNGDVVQLGNMGPRFAVVCGDAEHDTLPTLVVPATATKMPRDLSQTALFRIKSALGIPRDGDVSSLIRGRSRRLRQVAWGSLLAVVVVVATAFWMMSDKSTADAELRERLAADAATFKQQQVEFEQQRTQFEQQQAAWNSERTRLEQERTALRDGLQKLEREAGSSATEIEKLRGQLGATQEELKRYDPINVEMTRLQDVRRVTRAVVFIETRMLFRHQKSGKLLHVEAFDDKIKLNLEDRGEPYAFEGSGSGFVLDGGWVLTNAHVVRPDAKESPLADAVKAFDDEVELNVIFSGTAERHAARLVRWRFTDDVDVALLKIETFEDMPFLASIDLDLPLPEPPTEVYLAGFPLGRMAVQEGEVVIASTFKGILSRVVEPFFQVDAAVHPGNSGGPVMDNHGRILGIATRVQRTPSGPYTPTIGYITPIRVLRHVWPPPDESETVEATAKTR